VSFIRTGFREMALKVRRQRTRLALRHEKRLLQKSEINLGREGTTQAANFPELRNEIVALKKLEQEQKEVALRIAQIEEGLKRSRRIGSKIRTSKMLPLRSGSREEAAPSASQSSKEHSRPLRTRIGCCRAPDPGERRR